MEDTNQDIVELRAPDQQFPVDVAMKPRQLDAYQMSTKYSKTVTFGINSADTAKTLREIADRVESGEYIAQSGGIFSSVRLDDYAMTIVNIKFHAKRVAE